MNTINGDFIEKSIPNTKNATLDINIGGVDSTMTVENFASAIVIPPVLPYKSYVALVTQSGGNAPVATVIQNTLGGELTWQKTGVGQYRIVCNSLFTLNKTVATINNVQFNGGASVSIGQFPESSYLYVFSFDSTAVLTDNWLSGNVIEIRVYN